MFENKNFMMKKNTNLTGGRLRLKDCAFKAIAFTLALSSSFYATADASAININSSVSVNQAKADIVIRGIIKDETGAPLPGAGVKVKGSSASAAAPPRPSLLRAGCARTARRSV